LILTGAAALGGCLRTSDSTTHSATKSKINLQKLADAKGAEPRRRRGRQFGCSML